MDHGLGATAGNVQVAGVAGIEPHRIENCPRSLLLLRPQLKYTQFIINKK